MAVPAKTIVATGVSSGLGFEAIKQLLEQEQPYNVILGARNPQRTITAYDALQFDRSTNAVTVLPLELSDLKTVQTFAQQVLEKVGEDKVDYLLLNAAIGEGAEKLGLHGSKWCEALIVNHFSQHYLIHLLKEKVVSSKSRIVIVSSGGVRGVSDPNILDAVLKGGSGANKGTVYSSTKFIQLLSAHWWRRQLTGICDIVAVSPGLIPNTGVGSDMGLTMAMPDAKSVAEGARSILAAFTRSDFPEDPERIFLTSWGEWWGKHVYEKTLDKKLQDKWSLSKEEVEREAGIA